MRRRIQATSYDRMEAKIFRMIAEDRAMFEWQSYSLGKKLALTA